MLHDRFALVEFVPDALIVGDRDALVGAAVFQPLFVRTARRKQIAMPFDFQPCYDKNGRELLPEIAVGEINAAQAARSYRTASSISSGLRS